MADAHGLAAAGRVASRVAGGPSRGEHPVGDLLVRLAPRGPQRIAEVLPVRRVREQSPSPPATGVPSRWLAASISRSSTATLEPGRGRRAARRSAGPARAVTRRGSATSRSANHSAAASAWRSPRSLSRNPGQPSVEHAVGIVHLAVPEQMDGHGDHPLLLARAARRVRAPRGGGARRPAAAARRRDASRAPSRPCAALTNHASNADGGRYTPASSMAWKNGGYRQRLGCLRAGEVDAPAARRRRRRTGCRRTAPGAARRPRSAHRRASAPIVRGVRVERGVDRRVRECAAWRARPRPRPGSRTACRPGRPARPARAGP